MSFRALICDDDRLHTKWLSKLLAEWGLLVASESNVPDAIRSAKKSLPGLVIHDLNCGDHTAADFMKLLHELPGGRQVPVIIISASSERDISDAVAGYEVSAIISKPIDVNRLRTVVSSLSNTPSLPRTLSLMVLDRNGIIQKVTGRMVEEMGAFPIYAESVERAKAIIRNMRPDGIITDCDASDCEIEALFEYCRQSGLTFPPLIVLASVLNDQIVKRLLKIGARDILLKPIQVARLQESVARIAESRQVTPCSQGTDLPKSILVVEDFTITANMLERILQQGGYTVQVARSGEVAFEMVRKRRPDMMILDINLPRMTGFELLEALVQENIAVPALAVTGERDTTKLRNAKKFGVLRVFSKPLDSTELLSYLEGYFSNGQGERGNTSRYHVLLALADETAANVLKSALTPLKLECKVVTDGYQAVNELAEHPRVAVVDIVIGGLDGTEVLRRANKGSSSHTKLLAIANELDDEVVKELKELGAHEAIGKPYDISAIIEKIRDLLSQTTPSLSVSEVATEVLPLIRAALSLQDREFFRMAGSIGHNLAGTAAHAGLPQIAEAGQKLEDAARSGNRGIAEKLLHKIRAELDARKS